MKNLLSSFFTALLTLFFLAFLTFFLLRVAPGGPFDSDRAFPPEVKAAIDARYGLNESVLQQFSHYCAGLFHGDLGESFQYIGRPVLEIIQESFLPSIELGTLALILSICLGIPLGAFAAWKKGTWMDWLSVFLTVAGISLPGYLVASLLILVFSLHLGWFPPALWEDASSWVLPVITLSFRPIALLARLTRTSMVEALNSDYIRTARSKGASGFRVIGIHALKNSLIPVISLLGPLSANLLTGSFLVEVVFQIPGLGRHFVNAMMNRDYPLVMGVTLFYGVVLIISNAVTDHLSIWADPRLRSELEQQGDLP